MLPISRLSILMLFLTACLVHGMDRELLGVSLHPFSPGSRADTLYWTSMGDSSRPARQGRINGPKGSCPFALARGKAYYRIENPSAISMAIVLDYGYEIMALTRWFYLELSTLAPSSIGTGSECRYAALASDYLWERIAGYSRPDTINTGSGSGFSMQFDFYQHGASRYTSKTAVCNSLSRIYDSPSAFRNLPDKQYKRGIYELYIIADSMHQASAFMDTIEMTMTKLGLDLSYKAPSIKKIQCSITDTIHYAPKTTGPAAAPADTQAALPETPQPGSVIADDSVLAVPDTIDTLPADTDMAQQAFEIVDMTDTAAIAQSADTVPAEVIAVDTSKKPDAGIVPPETNKDLRSHETALEAFSRARQFAVTGNALLISGMVLDYLVLSRMTMNLSGSSADESATMILLSGLAVSAMKISGPLLACSGASNAHDYYRANMDPKIKDFWVWKLYGAGWAAAIVSLGLRLSAILAKDQPMAIASVASAIARDALWCTVGILSLRHINKLTDQSTGNGISISPLFGPNNSNGLAITVDLPDVK